MNRQVNLTIPQEWLERLQKEARERSVKEEKTINYLDLIREAVKKEYNLKDKKE